jgi:hypothetical protein
MAVARAKLGLPKIEKTSDRAAAASTVTAAVAAGQDTPNEAAALSTLVENVAKSKHARVF